MEILQSIKEKLEKSGANDIIVDSYDLNATQYKFYDNKVSTVKNWGENSINVFIAIGKKIGVTSIDSLNQDKINEAVDKLIEFTKRGSDNEEYNGIAEGPFEYKKINGLYDNKLKDLDGNDIVESVINKGLECNGKRITGVFEIKLLDRKFVSNKNIEKQEKLSDLYLSVRALVDKYATGHITCTSRLLKDLNYEESASEAGMIANDAKNPIEGKEGKYDVVFSPLAFAGLLSKVGDSASIFSVESGLSFLKDKIGQKISNKNINLYDDATVDDNFGSFSFDKEGHATQKNILIENGVFKTYLHNTSTAKRYNTESTGNAGLIGPDCWSLILDSKSKVSKEELFKDIKNGLYITNIWYTRFQNYSTGEFSTIPRDGCFLIENGEIKDSIKNIRVSENMPNILNNLSLIGNDIKQIRSWEADVPCTLPHVKVNNVNVTRPLTN